MLHVTYLDYFLQKHPHCMLTMRDSFVFLSSCAGYDEESQLRRLSDPQNHAWRVRQETEGDALPGLDRWYALRQGVVRNSCFFIGENRFIVHVKMYKKYI